MLLYNELQLKFSDKRALFSEIWLRKSCLLTEVRVLKTGFWLDCQFVCGEISIFAYFLQNVYFFNSCHIPVTVKDKYYDMFINCTFLCEHIRLARLYSDTKAKAKSVQVNEDGSLCLKIKCRQLREQKLGTNKWDLRHHQWGKKGMIEGKKHEVISLLFMPINSYPSTSCSSKWSVVSLLIHLVTI